VCRERARGGVGPEDGDALGAAPDELAVSSAR
jgi:hypothetical protein